ncbi:MAG: VPLPA-CTERM sorting domain-containing protein [Pseudooceanicola sp.]
MKSILAAAFGISMLAGGAQAASTSIGFEGLSNGSFTGMFNEDGYSLNAVDMYVETGADGTDGVSEMERLFGTSGYLEVTRPGMSFMFESIDLQVERDTASVSVLGFFNGLLVGTDTYNLSSLTYSTYSASNLAGVTLDALVINAQRDFDGTSAFDALVLSDSVAAVPLPAAGWALIAALGGLYGARRRKG